MFPWNQEVKPVVMQTSAAPVGPLRRMPVQGSGLPRVRRRRAACAELGAQFGYGGLTATLLADKAGVAIGSVYQFFPDKRALVQALTLRRLDAHLERLSKCHAHR